MNNNIVGVRASTIAVSARSSKGSAFRSWWQWVWFPVFIGGLVFTVRDADAVIASPLEWAVLHRVVITLGVAVLLLPSYVRHPKVMVRGIIGLLMMLSIWRLASAFWSVNPMWTVYRSFEYIVVLSVAGYTAASLRDLQELRSWMNLVWGWFIFLLVTVVVGAIISPTQAIQPIPNALIPFMLFGVYPHINANSVGAYGAIIALVALSRLLGCFRNPARWIAPLVLGLGTMILAQGRVALVGFAAGLLVMLFLNRRYVMLLFMLLIAPFVSIGMSQSPLIWEYVLRGQSVPLFMAATGRTTYWAFAWEEYILRAPWAGHGAFSSVRLEVLPDVGRSGMTTMHNTWLEAAVEIGLPGALFLAIILFYTWIKLVRCALSSSGGQRLLSIELTAVLAVLTARSLFSTQLLMHSSYAFFLIAAVASVLHRFTTVDGRLPCAHVPRDARESDS